MAIAKKYGVDKNFSFQTPKGARMAPPDEVVLHMSLDQYESWMKEVGFQENKVAILKQFYHVDAPEVKSNREYVNLRKSYAVRYSDYLKDEIGFTEVDLKNYEKNIDHLKVFNKHMNRWKHRSQWLISFDKR